MLGARWLGIFLGLNTQTNIIPSTTQDFLALRTPTQQWSCSHGSPHYFGNPDAAGFPWPFQFSCFRDLHVAGILEPL